MMTVWAVAGFLFNTKLGRYAFGGAVVAGLVLAFALHQRSIGVKKERVRVETIGKKVDAKATAARRAAERDADRVLERYWRD